MDVLQTVVQALGSAVGGVLQVITDFINLIIEVLPNPDPFPDMIENMSVESAANLGFARYWLDAFAGIDAVSTMLGIWATLMIASAVFAVIYWVIKAIKP